jgi:hypothetical protein
MSTSNLSFYCESVDISPDNGRQIYVEVKGASDRNILDNYTISQIVDHFGSDDLLDEIGESDCVEHFNLAPNNPDEDD